jgi:PhnB protein
VLHSYPHASKDVIRNARKRAKQANRLLQCKHATCFGGAGGFAQCHTANVKDAFGNHWYIATFRGENYFSEGAPTVQPYLHPTRAEPLIHFLEQAFGAKELGRATSPEGAILHTTLKIGDAALEMSEADGPYQPMPSTFYLSVPDADTTYRRAIAAGAVSVSRSAFPFLEKTVDSVCKRSSSSGCQPYDQTSR